MTTGAGRTEHHRDYYPDSLVITEFLLSDQRLPGRDRRRMVDSGAQDVASAALRLPSLYQNFVQVPHEVGSTGSRHQSRPKQRCISLDDSEPWTGDPVIGKQLAKSRREALLRFVDLAPGRRIRKRPLLHRVIGAGVKEGDIVGEVSIERPACDTRTLGDRHVRGVGWADRGVQVDCGLNDLPPCRALIFGPTSQCVSSRDFGELLCDFIIDRQP